MLDSNVSRIVIRRPVIRLSACLVFLAAVTAGSPLRSQSVFDATREGNVEAVTALVTADPELIHEVLELLPAIETDIKPPQTIIMMLGGMIGPSVPEAAIRPAEKSMS